MNNIELWVVAVALAAVVAFLFQIVAVILTARSVRQVATRIERQSDGLEKTLNRVQSRLVEVSDNMEPLKAVAQDLSGNLSAMSETLQKRAAHADTVIAELMNAGRDQAAKIDYLVSDTVEKFEQTTETIQKDLLKPAIEISSLVRGIKSGLDALFSRSEQVKSKSDEEEMFI